MLSIVNILVPVLALVLIALGLFFSFSGKKREYVDRKILVRVAESQSKELRIFEKSLVYLGPGFFAILVLLFYFSDWQKAIGFLAGGLVLTALLYWTIEAFSSGLLCLAGSKEKKGLGGEFAASSVLPLLMTGSLSLLASGSLLWGVGFLSGLSIGIGIVAIFILIATAGQMASLVQDTIQKNAAWAAVVALATLLLATTGKSMGLNMLIAPIASFLPFLVFLLGMIIRPLLSRIKKAQLSGSIEIVIRAILLCGLYFPTALWLLRDLGQVSHLRAFVLLSVGVAVAMVFALVQLFFGRKQEPEILGTISLKSAQTSLLYAVTIALAIYATNYFGGLVGVSLALLGAIGYGLAYFFSGFSGIVCDQVDAISADSGTEDRGHGSDSLLVATAALSALSAFFVLGGAVFGRFSATANEMISPLVLAGGMVGVGIPILFLGQKSNEMAPDAKKAALNVFGLVFALLLSQFLFGLHFLGGLVLGFALTALPYSFLSRRVSSLLPLSAALALALSSAQAVAISGLSLGIEWRLGVLGLVIIIVSALVIFVWSSNEHQQKIVD